MKTSEYFMLCFLKIINLFEGTYGLPHEYCYPKPNLDDCGGKPTAIFSYYKPGSRCEIEVWRGCPTMNIFKNEYSCSHHCIGRLGNDRDDDNILSNFNISENEVPDHEANECEETLNEEDCKKEPVEVYTFDPDKKTCVKAVWKGCTTVNKFDDYQQCNKSCREPKLDLSFEEKIYALSLADAQEMDQILDEFLKNETEHTVRNELKLDLKHKVTLEAKLHTEVTPELETTTPVTEAAVTEAKVPKTEVTEAEVTQAEVTEAEATETEVTKAEVTEAEVTQAEVTEAEATETEVTKAEVTEADVTQAEVTEAEVTETEVTTAEATEAEATEAEVTTEEATTEAKNAEARPKSSEEIAGPAEEIVTT